MEKPSLDTAKAGAMRFNTDSSQMEIYDGNQWIGISATSPELQTGGTRGLIMGGIKLSPTRRVADVEFITINTTGNAIDFGELTQTNDGGSFGTSDPTRGLFGLNTPSGGTNIMEYISMSAGGTAVDFGDLTQAITNSGATSNAHGGL